MMLLAKITWIATSFALLIPRNDQSSVDIDWSFFCKSVYMGDLFPWFDLMITMIAAMSENRVIGKDNTLPWDYPEDLQRFRKLTSGKPVVMWRKTFDSIGRPLPNRRNIILSRQTVHIDSVEVYDTIQKILDAVKDEAEVMIIWGQTIYEQFLPYADVLEMTLIHRVVDGDIFFPAFGAEFHEVSREDKWEYSFVRYEK